MSEQTLAASATLPPETWRAPTAEVAPTRMRCRMPSGKIASGSPVAMLNNSTNPV